MEGNRRPARIALYVDVENLLGRDPAGPLEAEIGRLFEKLRARGTVVAAVGSASRSLCRRLAVGLHRRGLRLFPHAGGPDAADGELLKRIREVPASADTVVICSGDHAFAPAAAELRARGLRVEVVARPGTIAWQLFRAADHFEALAHEN